MKKRLQIMLLIFVILLCLLIVGGILFFISHKTISAQKALKIVFQDIGVTEVTEQKIEFDQKDHVYEIELMVGQTKYEYEVDRNGTIVKKEMKKNQNDSNLGISSLSLEQAKNIVMEKENLNDSNMTFLKEQLEIENGRPIYELDFVAHNQKYEYEIDAETGEIIKREIEIFNGDSSTRPSKLSLEEAKQIALEHANIKGFHFIKATQEIEDGILVYELEFSAEKETYEYEIDANTGQIITYEKRKGSK